MRMRLRLNLAYDGTDFHGWAAQPGLRTVQGELEAAIAVLLRDDREEFRLTVAGRTDAGVHARGQVAHIDVDDALAGKITARRLNGLLSRGAPDVIVHGVARVDDTFDARFSALSRRYEYRLRDATTPRDPLTARYTVDVRHRLDL